MGNESVIGDANFILENFKENLFIGVEPKQQAEYYTRPFLDIQAYVYIKGGNFVGKIRKSEYAEDHLEEMWKAAYKNTRGDITVGELGKYMDAAFGMGMIDDDFRNQPHTDVYVVTTKDGRHGAAAILINEAMEDLRERIGEYLIIPSSVHELLLVPNAIEEDLRSMLREVNDTIVDVKEILSYNVYRYDSQRKEVVLC